MQPDLNGSSRNERALGVRRARVAGTAILGIAVVVYWLGRLVEIW